MLGLTMPRRSWPRNSTSKYCITPECPARAFLTASPNPTMAIHEHVSSPPLILDSTLAKRREAIEDFLAAHRDGLVSRGIGQVDPQVVGHRGR